MILQNQLGVESIGEKMTNVSNTKKEGFRVWKNWRPKEDNQCAFNVYEVVVGSVSFCNFLHLNFYTEGVNWFTAVLPSVQNKIFCKSFLSNY